MMPSSDLLMMASSEDSMIDASRRAVGAAWPCRAPICAASADVAEDQHASRDIPRSSLIGAALSSIGHRRRPSESARCGWPARRRRPPGAPWSPGFSTGWRVSFVDDAKHRVERLAGGVALVQPVSDSATGFMEVMRPSTSVVMTASPMLRSVTCSTSRRWLACDELRGRLAEHDDERTREQIRHESDDITGRR